MAGLALEMAKEFKRYKDLEDVNGANGDLEKATYYMNKKWETAKLADSEGIRKEFSAALKELGVY